jgi:enoyl-CoA hydratase/carnithine racemase
VTIEVTVDSNAVLREKRSHIFYITLNRPPALNAINLDLSVGFHDAVEEFKADRDAFVAIVTGSGRAFCAGADLKDMVLNRERSQEELIARAQLRRERGNTLMMTQECWKPVIAALNGLALGGGFEIAMSCDLIIAASDIRLGLPECKRGIIPGIGRVKLAKQIPLKLAMEIMLTGEDRMTAQRGYELGIVNKVVPVEADWSEDQKRAAVVAAAEEIVKKMMLCAPLALQATKESVHKTRHLPEREAMDTSYDRVFRNSLDSIEGPRAFAEKRAPVWQNR